MTVCLNPGGDFTSAQVVKIGNLESVSRIKAYMTTGCSPLVVARLEDSVL